MQSARSVSFRFPCLACLAFAVALGCGSKAPRNGFDDDKSATEPPPELDLNGANGGFGGDPANTLVLDPLNATVVIDTAVTPVVPGTLVYKVSKNGTDLTG